MEPNRRNRLDLCTPAELAIYNAMQEVEKAGADVRLTEAIILLDKARNLIADFIECIPPMEKEETIVTVEQRTIDILLDDTFSGHPSREEAYQQRNAIKFLAREIDILHKIRIRG